MRHIILCALLIVLIQPCYGQFEYFNSEQFWKKMVLQKPGSKMSAGGNDTVIIMASNRVSDASTFRYLPEERDAGKMKFFIVYSNNGNWNVLPVSSLRQAVNMMPDKNRSWVVYTEGMGKFFTSDADRGMNLAAQYDVNVIMMDYPSLTAHRKRLGNYFFAKGNASIAYEDFMPVFDTIKTLQLTHMLGNKGVNLFFHSMGNIVMRKIVRKDRLDELNDKVWVNNLILNAPCVPQYRHKNFVDKIAFAKHIYIHYNPDDFTLGGAYLVSKRKQLGKTPKRPISEKATYINFNTIAGRGHSNFLNLSGRNSIPDAAVRHYSTLFEGKTVDVNNRAYYKPTDYHAIGYDLLPTDSDAQNNMQSTR